MTSKLTIICTFGGHKCVLTLISDWQIYIMAGNGLLEEFLKGQLMIANVFIIKEYNNFLVNYH